MFQITQKYTAPKHLTILMRVCARKGGTKPRGWPPSKKATKKARRAHARFKATRNVGVKVWIYDVDVFVVALRRYARAASDVLSPTLVIIGKRPVLARCNRCRNLYTIG